MNNIILETLKSKLQSIQKKRDILYNEMNRNYYAEIIKTIDNRDWEIYQWRLRIVGRASKGTVDEIVPNHM